VTVRESGPSSVVTLARGTVCAHCGVEFTPKRQRRDTRFCRATCRARWHASRRERLLREIGDALAVAASALGELRRPDDGSPSRQPKGVSK